MPPATTVADFVQSCDVRASHGCTTDFAYDFYRSRLDPVFVHAVSDAFSLRVSQVIDGRADGCTDGDYSSLISRRWFAR